MEKWKRIREDFHRFRRRAMLWRNRLRIGYSARRKGRLFQLILPSRHKSKVHFGKYLLGAIGLFSVFFAFRSVWYAFGFGLVLFLLTWLVESTVFAHPAMFIHGLPTFELDPDKWVGVAFGYATPPPGEVAAPIPLVGMTVTDKQYAHALSGLLAAWTGGSYIDVDRNISVSVVVTGPEEFIFLCHPNLKRPVAKAAFRAARDDLQHTSLDDVIVECHGLIIFGKRCRQSANSTFPFFTRRYAAGTPVLFGFIVPPFESPDFAPGIPTFVVHDFSIKAKEDLTREDFEFDAIGAFEVGGEWQGPPELLE